MVVGSRPTRQWEVAWLLAQVVGLAGAVSGCSGSSGPLQQDTVPKAAIPDVVHVGTVLAGGPRSVVAHVPVTNQGLSVVSVRVIATSSPCCVRAVRGAVRVPPHATERLAFQVAVPTDAQDLSGWALLELQGTGASGVVRRRVYFNGRVVPALELVLDSEGRAGAQPLIEGTTGERLVVNGWLVVRRTKQERAPSPSPPEVRVADNMLTLALTGPATSSTTGDLVELRWPVRTVVRVPTTPGTYTVPVEVSVADRADSALVTVIAQPLVRARPPSAIVSGCPSMQGSCPGHMVRVALEANAGRPFDVTSAEEPPGITATIERARESGWNVTLIIHCTQIAAPLQTVRFKLQGVPQTEATFPILITGRSRVAESDGALSNVPASSGP